MIIINKAKVFKGTGEDIALGVGFTLSLAFIMVFVVCYFMSKKTSTPIKTSLWLFGFDFLCVIGSLLFNLNQTDAYLFYIVYHLCGTYALYDLYLQSQSLKWTYVGFEHIMEEHDVTFDENGVLVPIDNIP